MKAMQTNSGFSGKYNYSKHLKCTYDVGMCMDKFTSVSHLCHTCVLLIYLQLNTADSVTGIMMLCVILIYL